MNRDLFKDMGTMLARDGWRILRSRYDERVFGSWFIVFSKGRKRLKAVWDGRDSWMILQKGHRSLVTPWAENWTDVWIAKDTVLQTPNELVSRARQLAEAG